MAIVGIFRWQSMRPANRVIVVFRWPARLLVLSSADGSLIADVETCGDADDVFVDTKRRRAYVICGAGVIDIFEQNADGYRRIGQAPHCARWANRLVRSGARPAVCGGPGSRPGAGRYLGIPAGAMNLQTGS